MPLPVTVCVPVKNEQRNLPQCLEALGAAFAEVVVVDSGSTDDTTAIAAHYGAALKNFDWTGHPPKKRNWFLRTHDFKTSWVLFLDADERVTPAFIHELETTLPQTHHVGFWVRFDNWFMEDRLAFGDCFRKLALFRVDAGEYETFPEDLWSTLDMEVHEHPVLNGSVGCLRQRIDHHDYRGLHNYIAKHNEYSSWEARRYWWLQSAPQHAWETLTKRQRFKYRYLNCFWLAPLYFGISYFFKLGFLDGGAGFRFALMKWRYFSDIRLKIEEQKTHSTATVRMPPHQKHASSSTT